MVVDVRCVRSRGGHLFAHLVEANVLGLLAEALTAQVEVVLSDQTGLVLADAAVEKNSMLALYSFDAWFVSRGRRAVSPMPSVRRRATSQRGGLTMMFARCGRDGTDVKFRTSCESPCRRFAGASSRRFRET